MRAGTRWRGVVAGLAAFVGACDNPSEPEDLSYRPGRVYTVPEAIRVCQSELGGVFDLPVYEVKPPDEARDLEVQIFATGDGGWRPSFLLYRGEAVPIGPFHLGTIESVVVADLDGDGHSEVLIGYDQSAGKWNKHVWSYEPATGETIDQRWSVGHPVNVRLVGDANTVYAFDQAVEWDPLLRFPGPPPDPATRLGRVERVEGPRVAGYVVVQPGGGLIEGRALRPDPDDAAPERGVAR